MPYTLDGNALNVSDEPQVSDGTMWVPFRAVGEALGAKVEYEPSNKVAMMFHGDKIISVKIGDPTVDVDGEKQELQAPPYVSEGDTWVPVRFYNAPLGYGLNVDLNTNQVNLTSPVAA